LHGVVVQGHGPTPDRPAPNQRPGCPNAGSCGPEDEDVHRTPVSCGAPIAWLRRLPAGYQTHIAHPHPRGIRRARAITVANRSTSSLIRMHSNGSLSAVVRTFTDRRRCRSIPNRLPPNGTCSQGASFERMLSTDRVHLLRSRTAVAHRPSKLYPLSSPTTRSGGQASGQVSR
jgi:hypothetical protein